YSPFQWISPRPGSANIVSRHDPPGLASIDTEVSGTSDSAPPNQSAKRSGSVHSCHTRSRGASKTRVIVIPCSAIFVEALAEPVEATFPETTVSLEPVGRFFKRLAVEPRGPELCGSGTCDQAGVLEDLEVSRDGLNRDRERLRELVHAGFPGREALGECRPRGGRG